MDNTKEIPYLKAWNVTVKDDYKPYLIVTKRVKVKAAMSARIDPSRSAALTKLRLLRY
jgi:hypothetical protein